MPDRVQLVDQVEMLQRQLASRPPKSEIDSLRSEFRFVPSSAHSRSFCSTRPLLTSHTLAGRYARRIQESLLSGFQRENEKAMKDIERAKARERLLEAELEKLVGPNWAVSLPSFAASDS
jgi:hypothetical protein